MKRYKPIEGLLITRRRKGAPWSWVIILGAVSVGLAVYIFLGGGTGGPSQAVVIQGKTLGDEVAEGSLSLVEKALDDKRFRQVEAQAPPDELPLIETSPEKSAPVIADPDPEPEEPPVADNAPTGDKPEEVEVALAPPSEDDKPPQAPEKEAPEPIEAPEKKTEEKQAPKVADKPPEKPAPGPPTTVVMGKNGAFEGKLKRGETLYKALASLSFSARRIQPAIDALSKVVDFKRSRPGDQYAVKHDKEGRITELRYRDAPESIKIVKLAEAGQYAADEEAVPMEVQIEVLGGTVSSSLYIAMRDLGYNHVTITRFTDIFAYDINFASETKPGDTFRLALEKFYIEGRFVRTGRILAAEYKGARKKLRAYRFGDNRKDYFDKTGRSLRRMFMASPVKFARITSKFGKRFHPILKRPMMHSGVDYAAPTGTDILAIADGKVVSVGPKGANGNLVILSHPNGMQSLYAHMSRFHRKMKAGVEVKQGEVIGYVGSTGRSTGPHLHLAVKDGKRGFIDPLSIKSTRGQALRGRELREFRVKMRDYDRHLNKAAIKPPSKAARPAQDDDLGGTD